MDTCVLAGMSQSPYGAKWSATNRPWMEVLEYLLQGRNPLTGLTGLSGLQRGNTATPPAQGGVESQSPYGAKWFATTTSGRSTSPTWRGSRNPLTGLCGLQPGALGPRLPRSAEVAIPLRGYVGCNASSGRTTRGTSPTCRNPLTGLSGLQPAEGKSEVLVVDLVAIPLRG